MSKNLQIATLQRQRAKLDRELHRPPIEDEVWEGDPLYESFPVKIKVRGVWFVREDH